ncbi:very-short-patch-repair endonuclease [Allocatelliglobosispora scoriae]|uniref:Very-short-patch-repair endonuclease n=1 Tax=Allocatelliglobosispora scoriae TaxID=643052 RepID=A0A841BRU5_9ACTN|nr:DUF559 domain-containing protein [Allocatelliglobosispora scoriae]MBB5870425.1 very-short-patch-repair endonuclease [Allocatelliglobosispora scoriae]
MPRVAVRPRELTGRIFSARSALQRGLLTPADLHSTAWQRLFRGVYADRALTITHLLRVRAAAKHLLPADAVIAGRSAAYLHGADVIPDDDPVEIISPRSFGPMRGIRSHLGSVASDETAIGPLGLPVTTPVRTCWDLARWLDTVEAVVIIDILAAKHVVTIGELKAHALAQAGTRGWLRLSKAADLADAGSESPQESRLRVGLVRSGVPRPVTQHAIYQDGTFIARVDLAWPQFKIAIEYDGQWHIATAQFHKDRRRLNALQAAGWIVLHVTSERLRNDLPGVVAELRAAIATRKP